MRRFIRRRPYSRRSNKQKNFRPGLKETGSEILYLEEPGIFETMRLYDGKVFRLNEHLERLFDSANSIGISLNKSSLKNLIELYRNFLFPLTLILSPKGRGKGEGVSSSKFKKNKLRNGYIRVAINRKGDVDIIFKSQKIYPEELYEKGIELISVPVKRNLIESQNPKIKSRDFLWGVMAKIDLQNISDQVSRRPGLKSVQRDFEAILLNKEGYITEGTVSNIFIVKDDFIFTPPSFCGVLEGITRKYVIELAIRLGFGFKESILTRHDIYNADESFLTNTSMEIMPVVRFDGRLIGSGRPGEITKRLIEEFKKGVKFSDQVSLRPGLKI